MAECPDEAYIVSNSSRITSSLLIKIEDLVNCHSVERQRLEFKASWNKGPTQFQIVKTICAFANDYYNDNGGYIVIGIAELKGQESAEQNRQIELPPVGINAKYIETMQKEISGACKRFIKPAYVPILSPEILEDKHVLVIWVQPSDSPPHRAKIASDKKSEYLYFIRKGPETVQADDKEIQSLLQNANKIPFDDRMAIHESGKPIHYNAIAYRVVMKFLRDVNSKIKEGKDLNTLKSLKLVIEYGDHVQDGHLIPCLRPRNVALLMFNHVPHEYFPGAKIEVTQFTRDNEVIYESEKEFKGPLQDQIQKCMDYVYDTTNKQKSLSLITYPHKALREAIVNAVYHRGYERQHNSTTKVNIRPDCLEIISYPGPHPNLKVEEFRKGSKIPKVPARNRRIGDFLKELHLAEARGTGVSTIFRTMEKNDNPTPKFTFDSDHFCVTLPAHPKFQAAMLLKDVEEFEASGNFLEASGVLQKAFDEDPTIISQHLMQKLITLLDNNCEHPNVKKYEAHILTTTKERCSLLKELRRWLKNETYARENIQSGVSIVKKLVRADADAEDLSVVTDFVRVLYTERTVEMRKPILESNQAAHQLLEAYGQHLISENGVLAFHFACIKYQIFKTQTHKKDRRSIMQKYSAILRYLTDACDLLENAVRMSTGLEDQTFFAEQQRQLGYILRQMCRFDLATISEYEECFCKAQKADPKIRINPYW